jgi:hypothetical protein
MDVTHSCTYLAGTLIIWDRLFGTFAEENEEVVYGLTHNIDTFDIFTTQFHHYTHMWKVFVQQKCWSDRLSTVWKGPGWAQGKPRLGDINDIPDVHAPIIPYNTHVPYSLSAFCFVQSVVAFPPVMVLLNKVHSMPPFQVLIALSMAVWQFYSVGLISNRSAAARSIEALRLGVILTMGIFAILTSSTMFHPLFFNWCLVAPNMLNSLIVIFSITSLMMMQLVGPWAVEHRTEQARPTSSLSHESPNRLDDVALWTLQNPPKPPSAAKRPTRIR